MMNYNFLGEHSLNKKNSNMIDFDKISILSDDQWDYIGADNVKLQKQDIINLLLSTTKDDAQKAEFKIENIICKNQGLFDSAIPVVKLILLVLPIISVEAKRSCVELLVEISYSTPMPSSPRAKELCMKEMLYLSWYFIFEFQFGDDNLKSNYASILKVLSDYFEEIKQRVEYIFSQYEKENEKSAL